MLFELGITQTKLCERTASLVTVLTVLAHQGLLSLVWPIFD
ncbi:MULTISPECIES: hypothetical protein [unclassified Gilliamella]|nr:MULTISPECIES: hypothetical protein [unclassified Gilliamella]